MNSDKTSGMQAKDKNAAAQGWLTFKLNNDAEQKFTDVQRHYFGGPTNSGYMGGYSNRTQVQMSFPKSENEQEFTFLYPKDFDSSSLEWSVFFSGKPIEITTGRLTIRFRHKMQWLTGSFHINTSEGEITGTFDIE
jgi:hypothetical protein